MPTLDKYMEQMNGMELVKGENGAYALIPPGIVGKERDDAIARQLDNFAGSQIDATVKARADAALVKLRERNANRPELIRIARKKQALLESGEITLDDLQRLAKGKNPQLAERLAQPD